MTASAIALSPTQERRASPRIPFHGSVTLELLNSTLRVATQAVNLSERGLCLRTQEALDINSRLRLRLQDQTHRRPVACRGRVTWIVQRLDLQEAPPFVYDIGVEFIDPPDLLKRLASRLGITLALPPIMNGASRPLLRPVSIRNRLHVPQLTQEPGADTRWHLVVTVDGAPCFSQRYGSAREALQAWRQFKRRSAARPAARGTSPPARMEPARSAAPAARPTRRTRPSRRR